VIIKPPYGRELFVAHRSRTLPRPFPQEFQGVRANKGLFNAKLMDLRLKSHDIVGFVAHRICDDFEIVERCFEQRLS
jgi:hypothetical protein